MFCKFYLKIWGLLWTFLPISITTHLSYESLNLSWHFHAYDFQFQKEPKHSNTLYPRVAAGSQKAVIRPYMILIMAEVRTPGHLEQLPKHFLQHAYQKYDYIHTSLVSTSTMRVRTMSVLFNSMFSGSTKQKGFKKYLLNEWLHSCSTENKICIPDILEKHSKFWHTFGRSSKPQC